MKRNLRMLSGAVLYIFVTCHLLNMAFGLISVEAVESARRVLTVPWTVFPISPLLLLSMLVHAVLGLEAIYRRNTLRMSSYDTVQLISGLLVVPLLASHIVGIWAVKNLFASDPTYHFILTVFWIDTPIEGLRQVLVVVVAWLHGSIGIFSWMRLKASWDRLSLFIYPLVVVVPVLALVGFVDAGNEVIADRERAIEASSADEPQLSEEELRAQEEAAAIRAEEIGQKLDLTRRIMWTVIGIYSVLVVITFVARAIRLHIARRARVSVRYLHGPQFEVPTGASMLEISRLHHLPHANLCRGRGRCGTCRIRIIEADPPLPEPGPVEAATLKRKKLDPDIRLACQVVPGAGSITIERLIAPDILPGDLHAASNDDEDEDQQPAAEGANA
ncbi:2Fe-2S iron-sulfur cluster-binding protein [Hoeflea sp. TYP-13]|uniref:2Fe-2S iron-sulfur cluster-binding protein n=1 Tax=Hoeflea sp. TYP-13 TaxID=3230023 RepID=UPI0034C61854